MAIRQVVENITANQELVDSIKNEDEYSYAHLIKFEKPTDVAAVGELRKEARDYSYITDSSINMTFDDGSKDAFGNSNGTQTYIANKILSVGTVNETTKAKASTMTLQLSGTALGITFIEPAARVTAINSGAQGNLAFTEDFRAIGLAEGDTILIENTGKADLYARIDVLYETSLAFTTITGTAISDGTTRAVNISLASHELQALILSKNSTNYSSYINREAIIYRVHLDPVTGDTIGAPFLLFKGIVTGGSIKDNSLVSSKVSWTLTSHWGDFLRVSGRITSDESHRALDASGTPDLEGLSNKDYANDLGFMHAEKSINVVATYQREEIRYKTRRRGGIAGVFGGRKLVEYTELVDQDVDLNFNLAAKYLPIVYGVQKVSGIPVFADSDKNSPEVVYVAQAFCEGPIEAVYDIYLDDQPTVCINKADSDSRGSGSQDVTCNGRADKGFVLSSTGGSTFIENFAEPGLLGPRISAYSTFTGLTSASPFYSPRNLSVSENSNTSDGLLHEESYVFTQPKIEFTFHAGLPDQLANGILAKKAENLEFKVQTEYFDGNPAEYWGGNHRLLDTAYSVMKFTLDTGEQTIPEYEFVVKGKVLRCYNYDQSFNGSGSAGVEDTFILGDIVNIHNPSGTVEVADAMIIDKFIALGKPRFRFSKEIPSSLTSFYMAKTATPNVRWNMTSDAHVVSVSASGTTRTIAPVNLISINNSGNQRIITTSAGNADFLYATQPGSYIHIAEDGVLGRTYTFIVSAVGTNTITLGGEVDYVFDSVVAAVIASPTRTMSVRPANAVKVQANETFTAEEAVGSEIEIKTPATTLGAFVSNSKVISAYNETLFIAKTESPFLETGLVGVQPGNGTLYSIGAPDGKDVRASINPALQLLDYLKSERYGKGLKDSELDLESFLAAARACDSRSDVTVACPGDITSNITVGDELYYNRTDLSAAEFLAFQGTISSITLRTATGTLYTEVTFTDVIGKLGNKWSDHLLFKEGDLVWHNGKAFLSPTDGTISTAVRDTELSNGVVSTITLKTLDNLTSVVVDCADFSATGNPIVKRFTSEQDGFISGGYSLYDSDDCVYWVYLGWDTPDQRNVTRHQTNQVIDTATPIFDNINSMLDQFNGVLRYANGKYQLDIKTKAPAFFDTVIEDISEVDILGELVVDDKGVKKTYNSITSQIIDPANRFGGRSINFMNSKYKKEDKGVIRNGTFSLPGISNYYNARINTKQFLDESRYGLNIKFTVGARGYLLLSGSIIRLSYSRFGWEDKYFRIDDLNFSSNGLVSVTATEHNNDAYILESITSGAAGIGSDGGNASYPSVYKAPLAPQNLTASTSSTGAIQLNIQNGADFNAAKFYTAIYRAEASTLSGAQALTKPTNPIAIVLTNSYNDLLNSTDTVYRAYWIEHGYNAPNGISYISDTFPSTTQGIIGDGSATPGGTGNSLFTWVAYADEDLTGTNAGDTVSANIVSTTRYIGYAYNKAVNTPSLIRSDYVWSFFIPQKGLDYFDGVDGIYYSFVFINNPINPGATGGSYSISGANTPVEVYPTTTNLTPSQLTWGDDPITVEGEITWVATRAYRRNPADLEGDWLPLTTPWSISKFFQRGAAGDPGTYVSVTPTGASSWTKNQSGVYIPNTSSTSLTIEAHKTVNEVLTTIHTTTMVVSRSGDTLSETSYTGDTTDITRTIIGDGSQNLSVVFTHVPSGAAQTFNLNVSIDGTNGTEGIATYQAPVYYRVGPPNSTTAPLTPAAGDGSYNFATNTLVPPNTLADPIQSPNNWSVDIPAGESFYPVFVSLHTFVGQGAVVNDATASGNIQAGTWSTPTIYTSEAAVSTYSYQVFRRGETLSDVGNPGSLTGADLGSYNFSTNSITPPTNWSVSVPAGDGNVWVSTASVTTPGDTATNIVPTYTNSERLVQGAVTGSFDHPTGTTARRASNGTTWTPSVGANQTSNFSFEREGVVIAAGSIEWELTNSSGDMFVFSTVTLTTGTNGDVVLTRSLGTGSGPANFITLTHIDSGTVISAEYTSVKEGVNSKTLVLSADSQTMSFNKTGGVIGSNTITLTARGQNLTDTITWATVPAGLGTAAGNTYSVPSTAFTSNSSILVTATSSGDSLSDSTTLTKLQDGVDNISVVLSNENHTLSANTAGAVSSFADSGTQVRVYQGATLLTYVGTTSTPFSPNTTSNGQWRILTPLGLTGGVASSNPTDSGSFATFGAITAMTQDSGARTITVAGETLSGTTFEIPVVQSFSKARQGATGTGGTNARSVELTPTVSAISYNTAGALLTTSIDFSTVSRGTSGALTYEFFVNGSTTGTPSASSTLSYSPPNNYSTSLITVRVDLLEDGSVVASDQVTLSPVKSGSDTITVTSSNEAHVFPATFAGAVSSYAGSGTTIEVYQGISKLTFVTGTGFPSTNNRFTITTSSVNINPGTRSGTNSTTATYGIASGVANGIDASTITYTIRLRNDVGQTATIPLVQSFSKSKIGDKGADAIYGGFVHNSGTVVTRDPSGNWDKPIINSPNTTNAESSTYSFTKGGAVVASGTLYWNLQDASGAVNIFDTLFQSEGSVTYSVINDGSRSPTARLVYEGVTIEATFTSVINGSKGDPGDRRVSSIVYYQLNSATAPSIPTATSFNYDTGVFTGLSSNWSATPPLYVGSNSNKYWISYYTAEEGSGVTFQAPVQSISFAGLVTFNGSTFTDGTNSYDTTSIDGANITTGEINAQRLDVTGIFAQDIVATGSITGAELIGGSLSLSSTDSTTGTITSVLLNSQNNVSPIRITRGPFGAETQLLYLDANERLILAGGLGDETITSLDVFSPGIRAQIVQAASEGTTGGSFTGTNRTGTSSTTSLTEVVVMSNVNTSTITVGARFQDSNFGTSSFVRPVWTLTVTARTRATSGSGTFANPQVLYTQQSTGIAFCESAASCEFNINANYAKDINPTSVTVGGDIQLTFTVTYNSGSRNTPTLFSIAASQAVEGGGTAGAANTLLANSQQRPGSYFLDYNNFINTPSAVTFNLGTSRNSTSVTVTNTAGNGSTIGTATTTLAGIMTAAMYSEHVANNNKNTNATHTGDVTGSGALTAANKLVPLRALLLGANVNLDTLGQLEDAGFYYQNSNFNAGTGTNWPSDRAGSLLVQKAANAGGYGATQLFIDYNSLDMYFRGLYNTEGPNQPWRRVFHTGNPQTSVTGNAGSVTNGVYTSRTISTGDGLSGGGNLSANRTLAVDSTVVRTTGTQAVGGAKTFSGRATFTGGSTIGGQENGIGNGSILIGSTASGIGIDSNEIYMVGGVLNFGTLAGNANDVAMYRGGVHRFSLTATGARFIGPVTIDSSTVITSNSTLLDSRYYTETESDDRFIRKNVGFEWTGTGGNALVFRSLDAMDTTLADQASLEVYQDTAGADAFMQFHIKNDYAKYFGLHGGVNDFGVCGWSGGSTFQRMYHDGYHPVADRLTTAITIGGVTFNGSASINLPGVNQAGTQNTSGTAANATNAVTAANLNRSVTAGAGLTGGGTLTSNVTIDAVTSGTGFHLTASNGRVVTNCNLHITSGFYGFNNVPANGTGKNFSAMIVASNIDVGFQFAGGFTNDEWYGRGWSNNGNTFYPWRRFLHDNNALEIIRTIDINGAGGINAGTFDNQTSGNFVKTYAGGNTSVTEIGRYLDFHTTGSTQDFDVRFDCNAINNLTISGQSAPAVITVNGTVDADAFVSSGRYSGLSAGSSYVNAFKGSALITDNRLGTNTSYYGWHSQRTPLGGFVIGTIGDSWSLQYATTAQIDGNANSDYRIFQIDRFGNAIFDGEVSGTEIRETSALKKKNVDYRESLEVSLDKVVTIGKLGTAVGTLKADETKKVHRWFIADEVNEVMPEVVHKKNGEIETLSYTRMLPDAYAAIAKQQEMIETLMKKVADLEEKLNGN